MNESVKARIGIVYNVVESVILAMSVGLAVWGATQIIDQGKAIVSISTRVAVNSTRLDRIEDRGSAGLQSHERDDNTRIMELRTRMDKVEAAIVELRQTPGKLEAISARLEALQSGQARIERMFEDHTKIK